MLKVYGRGIVGLIGGPCAQTFGVPSMTRRSNATFRKLLMAVIVAPALFGRSWYCFDARFPVCASLRVAAEIFGQVSLTGIVVLESTPCRYKRRGRAFYGAS